MHLTVRNARLLDARGEPMREPFDIVIADDPGAVDQGIVAIVERGTLRQSAPGARAGQRTEIDVEGATVLRGLHDHHTHLLALGAARSSVDCSPDALGARPMGLRDALLAAARSSPDGWVRGVGYFESVAGPLDRGRFDALVPELAALPIRVQHRSGTAWFCNGAALDALGLGDDPRTGAADATGGTVERDPSGRPTGRLFRLDGWLAERVPRRRPDLAGVGRELAAYGITGITDATPFASGADAAPLLDAIRRGDVPQRVSMMTAAPGHGPAAPLAVKVLLDDRDPLDLDVLAGRIAEAHRHGLNVAVHLTDRATTWLALSAWADAGVASGDRIEHGAVLDTDAVDRAHALGLTVVTNPGLAAARGDDHARDTEPDDVEHLWRCGSLLDVGMRVRGGTDAPYGPADPWTVLRDAIQRRTRRGVPIGSDRPLRLEEALVLFAPMNPTTDVAPWCPRVGDPADLCVLAHPVATLLEGPMGGPMGGPGAAPVALTMVGGRVIHQTAR